MTHKIWLIGRGATPYELEYYIKNLKINAPNSHLTVLIYPSQQKKTKLADNVWIFGTHGIGGGFIAFIRRVSWQGFDLVLEPWYHNASWIKFFICPHPIWQKQ